MIRGSPAHNWLQLLVRAERLGKGVGGALEIQVLSLLERRLGGAVRGRYQHDGPAPRAVPPAGSLSASEAEPGEGNRVQLSRYMDLVAVAPARLSVNPKASVFRP